MPFTPLHMGPGLIFKKAMPKTFSIMVFGWSQILMDIEPLYAILSNKSILHGFTHTYLLAIPIALIAALTGKYLGQLGLRILRRPEHISWKSAAITAFIGTISHVFLDSFMHADMNPYWPLVSIPAYYLNIDLINYLCISLFVIGVILLRKKI